MTRKLDHSTAVVLRDAYARILDCLHAMKAETEDLDDLLVLAEIQDELDGKLSRVTRVIERGAA